MFRQIVNAHPSRQPLQLNDFVCSTTGRPHNGQAPNELTPGERDPEVASVGGRRAYLATIFSSVSLASRMADFSPVDLSCVGEAALLPDPVRLRR